MSRIESITPFPLRKPPDATSPRAEECFLLRIVTEDGRIGWGEAHGSPSLTAAAITAPVTHASCQGVAGLLLGQDASDIAALRRRMEKGTQWIGRDGVVMQAIAACELALWDLAGKRADLPVSLLLDAGAKATIPCYASGKVEATPEATVTRLLAERDAGFSAHKIGWPPFGATEAGDIAYLAAARAALPDALLMVDAAQAWDEATALSRAQALARFNLGWIEEPLDRDDLAGQARLRAASSVPIAAGEGECGLPGLLRVAAVVDVLQPDLTRCGLLAARAAARHAPRVCSHSFTGALNAVIHAHWLAASPNAWLLEWPVRPIAIWGGLFPNAPVPRHGVLRVPEAPGWGLAPALS